MTSTNSIEKLLIDVISSKCSWVSSTPRPVHPSYAPVGQNICCLNGEHGGEVVLVDVASRPAILFEYRMERRVFNYGDGELSVYFKPLRALAPLGDVHQRGHVFVVAPSSKWTRIIKCTHEAVFGLHYVMVDKTEVVDGNA